MSEPDFGIKWGGSRGRGSNAEFRVGWEKKDSRFVSYTGVAKPQAGKSRKMMYMHNIRVLEWNFAKIHFVQEQKTIRFREYYIERAGGVCVREKDAYKKKREGKKGFRSTDFSVQLGFVSR